MRLERKSMTKVTANAPNKAAAKTAAKPATDKVPIYKPPPNISMTHATPRPAPLLIPRMEESASGLRNITCSMSPQTDSTQPVRRAVRACGKR
ncbi:unknown [Prevotella sp. CAG:520]|nr:unknown [Prevotella sp. CAG:520]